MSKQAGVRPRHADSRYKSGRYGEWDHLPQGYEQLREHIDRVKAGDILMMHATWFCEYAAGMLIGTRCCGTWYRKAKQ